MYNFSQLSFIFLNYFFNEKESIDNLGKQNSDTFFMFQLLQICNNIEKKCPEKVM